MGVNRDDHFIPPISLSLSGGGFRATLFHLGALIRLNQLGLFPSIKYINGVSGGAIVASYFGLQWRNLEFSDNISVNFEEQVVKPLRRFCYRNIDIWCAARVMPMPWRWRRAGNVLEGAYRRKLLGNASLQDLPDTPRCIIQSTNLLNGYSFGFSKYWAGNRRIGVICNPTFRLSEAVAASSAFPPFLSPFQLRVEGEQFESQSGNSESTGQLGKNLYLSDGGIVDNLGVGKKLYGLSHLISDAGAPPRFEKDILPLWFTLTRRSFDIALYQARPLLKADFFRSVDLQTYWSISGDAGDPMEKLYNYEVPNSLVCPREITDEIAGMRTRLNRFTEMEQSLLLNWGYAIFDIAFRKVWRGLELPLPQWPCPDYALDKWSA
jgi:NTE family protein